MSRENPVAELTHLREAHDRVAANLIELEIDSSRQLLEVSTLTGRSADRQNRKLLLQQWSWVGHGTRRGARSHLKARIDEALGRFERCQLGA